MPERGTTESVIFLGATCHRVADALRTGLIDELVGPLGSDRRDATIEALFDAEVELVRSPASAEAEVKRLREVLERADEFHRCWIAFDDLAEVDSVTPRIKRRLDAFREAEGAYLSARATLDSGEGE